MSDDDRMASPPNYPEVLDHLAQLAYRILRAHGMDRSKTQAVALDIADTICWQFGGTQLYIPRATVYRTTQRDAEMASKFTGNNYTELAHEYGLTESRVRAILNALAEAERRGRQSDLF